MVGELVGGEAGQRRLLRTQLLEEARKLRLDQRVERGLFRVGGERVARSMTAS
jgi:hypothetical protein